MNKEKKELKNNVTVVINLDELKEGTCTIKDFGGGDKRAICMEKGKLKIFELIDKE